MQLGLEEMLLVLLLRNPKLKPYFGIKDSAYWGYLGEDYTSDGIDHDDRVDNLIHFIRGWGSST